MGFFEKNRITAKDLVFQAFNFLATKYGQSRNLMTPASPFGQLLHVISELGELIFYYNEAAISEMNILKARNTENIYGISRLTGHNPTRGYAARGKIGLRLKPGGDAEFKGAYYVIPNFTKVISMANTMNYMIVFDEDFLRIDRGSSEFHEVQLIQGEYESQTFVSRGEDLQSFSAITKQLTDHNDVKVFVNGERWGLAESLYDMTRNERSCVVKTGINGGIDVSFGNEHFGAIPQDGAIIEVRYLLTRGSSGNLPSIDQVILKFEDSGYDPQGEEVDLNATTMIKTIMPPAFGSDAEEPRFTRMIAPTTSRSFVLANPGNYINFLRKYNYFSHVDAYTTFDDEYLDDDNVIYLFLLPDVTKKLTTDTNYFTIEEDEFILTSEEKESILVTLNESGRQMVTAEVNFVDPVIKKFSLTIVLRYFDKFNKQTIKTNIETKLGEYFLAVRRRDKIPRSDLVAIIEDLEGVDSVNVFFTSQENEEAIKNGYFMKNIYGYDPIKKRREVIETKKIMISAGQDPGLGIDEFGDIVIGPNELPLIRGGWENRDGQYIEEYPTEGKSSSLNVIFREKINFDIYNQINANKLKEIKNNNVS